jgi:hypothetical protein
MVQSLGAALGAGDHSSVLIFESHASIHSLQSGAYRIDVNNMLFSTSVVMLFGVQIVVYYKSEARARESI